MDWYQVGRVLLIVATAIAAGTTYTFIKDRRLKNLRKGEGLDSFISYFSREEIPKELLIRVYEFFEDWMNIKDFPIRPGDSLSKVYGIVNEDLDDAVFKIVKACNYRTPTDEDVKAVPPVKNVEDLVRFLNTLQRR